MPRISVPNLNIRTKSRKMSLPLPGALGWWFLSDSLESAVRNRVPGMPDAIVYGLPTAVDSGSALELKGLSNFLETEIVGPVKPDGSRAGLTIFCVGWTLDTLADVAHRPVFVGADGGLPVFEDTTNTAIGLFLRVFAANALSLSASRGTDTATDIANAANITGVVNTTPALMVCRIPAGAGNNTLVNRTTGQTATSAGAALPHFPTRQKIRIGSGYANYAGTCRISEVAIYPELTIDQEDVVVARLRRNQQRRWARVV
ncbi:hypothetical protein [Shinella sp. M31]|uniref:hypothetical protein n=1 Tax=Shinella sp. M31 TaxID=3368615 RepID=UPI003B9F4F37